MRDLIRPLIQEAREQTYSAARALGCESEPSAAHFRFRPDGRGGVLATPFPQIAGVEPAALAGAFPARLTFLTPPRASGDWLAFDPSGDWLELVRRADWAGPIPASPSPPIPGFPARIDPLLWRLDALMGITDPLVAARLDRGNPGWRIFRVRELARTGRGKGRPDWELVCHAALLSHLWADAPALLRQADALAQRYLACPGEDRLTARCLDAVLDLPGKA